MTATSSHADEQGDGSAEEVQPDSPSTGRRVRNLGVLAVVCAVAGGAGTLVSPSAVVTFPIAACGALLGIWVLRRRGPRALGVAAVVLGELGLVAGIIRVVFAMQ